MGRESMNISEEQWAEIQSRQKGGAPRHQAQETPSQASAIRSVAPPLAVKCGNHKMNRWEQEYAMELEARKRAGEILWYGFEAIKLKLTGGTFYTPDFSLWVMMEGQSLGYEWVAAEPHLQFHEVKGHLRDDANVKFKVAAELFPFAEFFMYRKRKAKEGFGWDLIKHLNGGAK